MCIKHFPIIQLFAKNHETYRYKLEITNACCVIMKSVVLLTILERIGDTRCTTLLVL